MLNEKLLKKDVFSTSIDGKTLFYAPLTRFFAVLDGSLNNIDSEWINEATSFRNVPDFIRKKAFSLDKDKIRLRLNITTDCNIRCSYCSVSAGHNPRNMPENIAIAAIDAFSAFAQKENASILEIVFSGGEPTLFIPLIKKCIIRAKSKLAENIGFQPRLLTNGLFNRSEYSEIIDGIEEVQVSWDGFFGKNQRYGSDSHTAKTVWENICFLIEKGVSISVLVVVSEVNFLRISEVVDQLYDSGIRKIFLGIRESTGRASGIMDIDYARLGKIYFDLWKKYREIGADINLTGTDIHSISPFPCSVPIPNYSISPEGVISACTISFNDNSLNAKVFEIGRLSDKEIKIDGSSLKRVRNFHVLNIPKCDSCIAKWHCRGGCVYAKNGKWFDSMFQTRCEMIREIVARKLLFIIDEQKLNNFQERT
jgi:radical SAM protein with 4Fe4S-binding SPASM domain